ncbi:MAG: hypothetical protein LBI43_04845 [Streptococcaceae bacterium]|nr:hypothetical protein [Streptococcaceae bacterium]
MEYFFYVVATIISAVAVTMQCVILFRQTKLQRELNDREEEEHQLVQAHNISTWIHSYYDDRPDDPDMAGNRTDFIISNSSQAPVYDAIVSIDDFADADHSIGIYVIPPGRWRVRYEQYVNDVGAHREGHLSHYPKAKIWFTDSRGRKWQRDANGTLNHSQYLFGEPLLHLPIEVANLSIVREK